MLSVKIKFCPLDWYSSSPTAIILYKRCICVKCFQAIAKSSKKGNAIYMKYVLHRLGHFDVRKRRNSFASSRKANS